MKDAYLENQCKRVKSNLTSTAEDVDSLIVELMDLVDKLEDKIQDLEDENEDLKAQLP